MSMVKGVCMLDVKPCTSMCLVCTALTELELSFRRRLILGSSWICGHT